MDRFNLDPRSCGKIQSYSRASMISIRSPFKRIEILGSHRASWQGSGPCPRWPSNRGGRYSSLTASNVTGYRVCLPSNSSGFARCGFDDSSRNQSTLDSITYFSLKFFLKGRAVWKGTAVSMWHTYIFWNFVAFFRNVKKSSFLTICEVKFLIWIRVGWKSPFPFSSFVLLNVVVWIDGTDRFLISTPFVISGKHETEHSFGQWEPRDTRQLLKAPDEFSFLSSPWISLINGRSIDPSP